MVLGLLRQLTLTRNDIKVLSFRGAVFIFCHSEEPIGDEESRKQETLRVAQSDRNGLLRRFTPRSDRRKKYLAVTEK